VLTDLLSWRWILFINVPIGLLAAVFAQRLLAEGRDPSAHRHFDFTGATVATAGLSLLVYGIVRTDTTGWGDATTLALIGGGVVLLLGFLTIEGRFAAAPLMPLRLFSSRSLSAANVIVFLVGGSTFGMWFFFSLYLQKVRGYSPLHAGIVFLPMTTCIIVGSTVVSRIVIRVGAKRLLIVGMTLLGVGLLLFAQLSVHGSYLGDMLAPSLITSIGMPFAFIPSTIAATSGVAPQEAGLASGVVNTARMFGGALGLAVLATLAASRTSHDLHHPTAAVHTLGPALVDGFQVAFVVGAAMAFVGALVAAFAVPRVRHRAAEVAPQQAALAVEA
jgi:MFS family permease